MLHQTWSTRNDYERKINYDWPKTHFHQDEKLFELFCNENDFAKYFANFDNSLFCFTHFDNFSK